jgi:hypothetical protein
VDAEGEDDLDVDAEGEPENQHGRGSQTPNATAGPSHRRVSGASPGHIDGRKRKRGSYMKDGPTVYKLIKPILKSIQNTKSRE